MIKEEKKIEDLRDPFSALREAKEKAEEQLERARAAGDLAAYKETTQHLREIAEDFKRELRKHYSPLPDGRRIFIPDREALRQFALDNGKPVEFYYQGLKLDGAGRIEDLSAFFWDISNLDALSGLTGLTSLNLRNTQIDDIGALSGLTGLSSLNLMNTKVYDISPLLGLTGLRSLDIRESKIDYIALKPPGNWLEKVFGGKEVDNRPVMEALEARGCRIFR